MSPVAAQVRRPTMFEGDVFKIATRSGEAAWTRAKCGRTRAQLSRTNRFICRGPTARGIKTASPRARFSVKRRLSFWYEVLARLRRTQARPSRDHESRRRRGRGDKKTIGGRGPKAAGRRKNVMNEQPAVPAGAPTFRLSTDGYAPGERVAVWREF